MDISEKRLKELERIESKMGYLEAGGVDDWEFYDESLKEYSRTIERDEIIESAVDDLACTFGEGAYEPSERGAGIAFTVECERAAIEILKDLIKKLEEVKT